MRLVLTGLVFALMVAFTAPVAFAQDDAAAGGGDMTMADYERMQEPPGYNSDYFFALSRSLGSSSLHPAAAVPLFIFTVPLDIVLLPFAAIGGFFG